MKNIKARTVAEIFVNQIVSRHGVPLEIHSDQGKSFEMKIFQELIKKTRTIVLHPQLEGRLSVSIKLLPTI